jgi:hypothetical protein
MNGADMAKHSDQDLATVPDVFHLDVEYGGTAYAVDITTVSGVCEVRHHGEPIGGSVFHPDIGFRFSTPDVIPLLPILREALRPYDAAIRSVQGRGSDPNLPILSKNGRRGAGLK